MSKETKKCPYCAEDINVNAIKCRYCGEFFNKEPNSIENKTTENTSRDYDKTLSYVKCESCKINLIGNYSRNLWGFHKYKCSKCGYETIYPLDSFYETVYWICTLLFGFWIFIILFVDQTASLGCLGILGLFGIPILLYNSKLKSEHPNSRIEEYNTING